MQANRPATSVSALPVSVRQHLAQGQVIPAHPLALTPERRLDERHQRALTRYYVAAGAGGIAVGVHTTQFEIRDPYHDLYRPVLELAARTADEAIARAPRPFVKVAGLAGDTPQAVREAEIATALGYHVGLLSLGAWRDHTERSIIAHCREVADVMPLFGFYLQPAVGGRVLTHTFWREFSQIANVWAIKIAPFDRYRTIDVVRAVAEEGRDDIALYTGNDDNIVSDLLTPFPVMVGGRLVERRIVGGLLGQWAVWTHSAVQMLQDIHASRTGSAPVHDWLRLGAALTDANGALFDVRHSFAGCIPGIHELLRRQGLMRGTWCLDASLRLSPGQDEEIDRILRSHPDLTDDAFVREGLAEWLQ